MRPIDADALVAQMESDAKQMEDQIAIMFTYAAISDVKHAPTVEAIPVEFIKGEIKDNKGFYNSSLRRLLDAWAERKDNEQ